MFQGGFRRFKIIGKKLNRCVKDVSMVFQGSFQKVSMKFEECFKKASKVFQGCFKEK